MRKASPVEIEYAEETADLRCVSRLREICDGLDLELWKVKPSSGNKVTGQDNLRLCYMTLVLPLAWAPYARGWPIGWTKIE